MYWVVDKVVPGQRLWKNQGRRAEEVKACIVADIMLAGHFTIMLVMFRTE